MGEKQYSRIDVLCPLILESELWSYWKEAAQNIVSAINTHIKDFKSSNVQDTDKVASWLFGIQHLIDSDDHPQEHFLIDRLAESTHGIVDLILKINDTA